MNWIRNYVDYYNFIGLVMLYAPDHFPKNENNRELDDLNLERAFNELFLGTEYLVDMFEGMGTVQQVFRILDQSFAAYQRNDRHAGASLLSELEQLIFLTMKKYAARSVANCRPEN